MQNGRLKWIRNIFTVEHTVPSVFIGICLATIFILFYGYANKNSQTAEAQTISSQPALIDYGENVYASNRTFVTHTEFAALLAKFLKEHPDLRVVDLEFQSYDNFLGSRPGWVIICEPRDTLARKP